MLLVSSSVVSATLVRLRSSQMFSDCCAAMVIMVDVCSKCKEHCEVLHDDTLWSAQPESILDSDYILEDE